MPQYGSGELIYLSPIYRDNPVFGLRGYPDYMTAQKNKWKQFDALPTIIQNQTNAKGHEKAQKRN